MSYRNIAERVFGGWYLANLAEEMHANIFLPPTVIEETFPYLVLSNNANVPAPYETRSRIGIETLLEIRHEVRK